MCYDIDEKKDMDLEFTFAKCKDKISSTRLIWRYTIMYETEAKTLETAHGYFKLSSEGKTILNLSCSYQLKRVKWLYFVAIDPINPMKRAWFNAIRGPAFGMPEIAPQSEVVPAPSTSTIASKSICLSFSQYFALKQFHGDHIMYIRLSFIFCMEPFGNLPRQMTSQWTQGAQGGVDD